MSSVNPSRIPYTQLRIGHAAMWAPIHRTGAWVTLSSACHRRLQSGAGGRHPDPHWCAHLDARSRKSIRIVRAPSLRTQTRTDESWWQTPSLTYIYIYIHIIICICIYNHIYTESHQWSSIYIQRLQISADRILMNSECSQPSQQFTIVDLWAPGQKRSIKSSTSWPFKANSWVEKHDNKTNETSDASKWFKVSNNVKDVSCWTLFDFHLKSVELVHILTKIANAQLSKRTWGKLEVITCHDRSTQGSASVTIHSCLEDPIKAQNIAVVDLHSAVPTCTHYQIMNTCEYMWLHVITCDCMWGHKLHVIACDYMRRYIHVYLSIMHRLYYNTS